MRIFFIGDIDDKPGLEALEKLLPKLKNEFEPDITIVNGENAANGLGIDKKSATIIKNAGADVITLGNHTWSNREINKIIDDIKYDIIRPVNFPDNNPGKGLIIKNTEAGKICVINAHGQESIVNILGKEIFAPNESPFLKIDKVLSEIPDDIKVIFIDFHAESTIEKMAFSRFVDGKVSVVVGTHTHVTTADEQILPGGTGYITDVGMTGDTDSVAGCVPDEVIEQYKNVRQTRWKGSDGEPVLNGIIADIDEKTGKCINIFRVRRRLWKDKIVLRLPHQYLSKFMKKLVKSKTLSEASEKIIKIILKKTGLVKGAFFEQNTISLIKRYSNFNENINTEIERRIEQNDFKDDYLRLFEIQDFENESVKYYVIIQSEKILTIDPFVQEIFLNFYSRLRKEKLLIQTNDELSILYEVGREVSSTIELYGKNGLLSRIMTLTTTIMNSESSSIILVDDEKKELYFVVGIGEKGDAIQKIRLKMGQGIAGWVAQSGKPAIVPDTSKDERFFNKTDEKLDYKTKSLIAVPLKIKDRVIGVLEVLNRKGEIPYNENDLEMLEGIANQAAAAIDNAKLYTRIKDLYKSIVEVLANTIDSKDSYTHGHSRRVAEYSVAIAREMGYSKEFQGRLEIAALLHDIGKIGIRDTILCKPGSLTDIEYEIIKEHPSISAKIIEPVDFLKDLVPVIKYHHEKYDGTGYPDHIKGEDIPIGARIIAVGDAFDAMTSDRAYRKGLEYEIALKELEKNCGTQFDPIFVKAFISVFNKEYKENFHELKSKFTAQYKLNFCNNIQ